METKETVKNETTQKKDNKFITAIEVTAVVALIIAIAAIFIPSEISKLHSLQTENLERYEVYREYSDEHKRVAEQYYTEAIKDKKTEDAACEEAITKTQDYIYNERKDFIEKYLRDKDNNGIPDGVDAGEITQEEIDKFLES